MPKKSHKITKKQIRSLIIPRWKKLLLTGLALTGILTGAYASKNVTRILGVDVIDVVDGDTFIIENHQPIRLYGVFAPELENCLGSEAKNALSSLILHKKVLIRKPISDGRGRVMGLVYSGGIFINDVMIRSGFAEYKGIAGTESETLMSAERFAREKKLGIFSPVCQSLSPPNAKCRIKGNYDDDKKEKVYVTAACKFYDFVKIQKHQGDAWFCTEAEARAAGFTKSPNCSN